MSQTKRHSLLEAIANIVIGYFVAVASQIIIFPMFGINIPFGDNFIMGILFTVVSLIRSYTLRRLFNGIT